MKNREEFNKYLKSNLEPNLDTLNNIYKEIKLKINQSNEDYVPQYCEIVFPNGEKEKIETPTLLNDINIIINELIYYFNVIDGLIDVANKEE